MLLHLFYANCITHFSLYRSNCYSIEYSTISATCVRRSYLGFLQVKHSGFHQKVNSFHWLCRTSPTSPTSHGLELKDIFISPSVINYRKNKKLYIQAALLWCSFRPIDPNNVEFWAFIDPSGQNQLVNHTPLLSKI